MDALKNFLGVWELEGSKNEYETTNAPKTGLYTITLLDEKALQFDMEWTNAEDKKLNASYTTVVDGVQHAYENPQIAEFIVTELLSENIMQTCTYKDGKMTSKGSRELINNSRTMLVVQETFLPTGETVTNKSVYNKI